jgi:hypothetical protein
MNKTHFSLLILCCVALTSLGGCNGKSGEADKKPEINCESFVEKINNCSKKDMPPERKEKFIAECKADQALDAKAYEPLLACASADSCDAFEKCGKEADKAVDKALAPAKVRKDIADKKIKDSRYRYRCPDMVAGVAKKDEEAPSPEMMAACKEFTVAFFAEEAVAIAADTKAKKFKDSEYRFDCEKAIKGDNKAATDDYKKACTALYTAWSDDLTTAITKTRDTATADTKNMHTECYELEKNSELLSGADGKKKAETLCEEQKLAIDAAKLNAEVDKYIAEKKTTSYYGCKSVAENLDKLGTDFAKTKKDAILKKCFIDHGKVILEVELPNMKSFCPFQIKNLVKSFNENKLAGKDPAFDALIAPVLADEKCTKE